MHRKSPETKAVLTRVVAASLFAAVVVLAPSAVAHAKPLSEKQWRKKTNAACVELERSRVPLLPPSGGGIWARKDAAAAGTYVTQAVPLYEALIAEVSGLDAPKSRAKTVKKFIAALTDGVAGIEATPISAFSPFDNPFQDAYSLSKKLGTKSCDGIANQRL
jgi:hypothetical protein